MKNIRIKELCDLEQTISKDLLERNEYPWEVLPQIHDFILELGERLDLDKFYKIKDDVWISKDAIISPSAEIIGPAIIDENVEIRHSAFIRGNVIIGKNSIIGNSTELKNSILFNDTNVPHFNYIGDSILGYKAHFGAGAITSNVRIDKKKIVIKIDGEIKETNLNKMGSIIGDRVEVGCNSVLNPGTIIGKDTLIYPISNVSGVIEENSIYKDKNNIVKRS